MFKKIKYFSIAMLLTFILAVILERTMDTAVAQTGTRQPTYVRHINGNVQLARKIQWRGSSHRLWIQNNSSTNNLRVSFDNGSAYWTIPPSVTDRYEVSISSVYLRGIGASISFEILIFQTSKQDVR